MTAPRTLRARIVLAALGALTLIGVVTGVVLLAEVGRDGRAAIDEELLERAERAPRDGGRSDRRAFGGGPGGRRGPWGPGGRDGLLAGSGSFVQVTLDGQVVDQRGDVPADTPAPPATDGFTTLQLDGEPWRVLTVTPPPPPGAPPLRLQYATTLAPVEARVARIRRLVLGLGLVALALTGLITWAATTVALRPLERLRAGAERVSGTEDLETPLAAEGPDEVRSVAAALNAMMGRLRASTEATERALEATRRFAADAGHELRTPLTGLRATLESLERNPELPAAERQALLRETLAEQARMVHLLEGLQALARGEAAERLPREEVELADLVDAAVLAARRRHPGTQLELVDEAGAATVWGWEGGLRLLVDNLLDNAALHGRANGHVEVRLTHTAGALALEIDDDGEGIPASEREALLAPFARGRDAHAPGTGLGLAIVAQQVALHGGALRLESSRLGGLSAQVRFPPAAAPSPGPRQAEPALG